jgi:hypothetical protein
MSDYVDRIFAGFIAETEGRAIDLTGAYGPQSPDLIVAYIQALTGSGWRFEYPYAVDLWEDSRGSMRRDFERVEDWQFKSGDIGVFKQTNGIGTLGILTGIHAPGRFKVFTQNPGPAGMTSLRVEDLLGAWRLTAGAECKAIATEHAARHVDLSNLPPATWVKQADLESTGEPRRRSFLARLADSVRGRK